jgi:7-carboxy-7-deazaguanine synthase
MNLTTKFTVNEIFSSINGEGTLSGELAIFIRLSGCNLRCSYCDTVYAQKNNAGKELLLDEIIKEVQQHKGIKNITLTGGEPLLKPNINQLLESLASLGYLINIETNGSVALNTFLEANYADKLIFCCDYKLPSSLEESKMCLDNLSILREQDVLKFVAGSKEDLNKAYNIIKEYKPLSYIYLSPIFNKIAPSEIVDTLKTWSSSLDTTKCRVQLQLHKYIWHPNQTGV